MRLAVIEAGRVVDVVEVVAAGMSIVGAVTVDVDDGAAVAVGDVFDGVGFGPDPASLVPGLREQAVAAEGAITVLTERLVDAEDTINYLILESLG